MALVGCGGTPTEVSQKSAVPSVGQSSEIGGAVPTAKPKSVPLAENLSGPAEAADRAPATTIITKMGAGVASRPIGATPANVPGGGKPVRPVAGSNPAGKSTVDSTAAVNQLATTPVGIARPAGTDAKVLQAPVAPSTLRAIKAPTAKLSTETEKSSTAASAPSPGTTEQPRLFDPLPVRTPNVVSAKPVGHTTELALTKAEYLLRDSAVTMTLPAQPQSDTLDLPDGTTQRTYHLQHNGTDYLVQVLDLDDALDAAAGAELMASLVDGSIESMEAEPTRRETVTTPLPGTIRFTAHRTVNGREVRTEGLATGRGKLFLQVTITGDAERLSGPGVEACLASIEPSGVPSSHKSAVVVSRMTESASSPATPNVGGTNEAGATDASHGADLEERPNARRRGRKCLWRGRRPGR